MLRFPVENLLTAGEERGKGARADRQPERTPVPYHHRPRRPEERFPRRAASVRGEPEDLSKRPFCGSTHVSDSSRASAALFRTISPPCAYPVVFWLASLGCEGERRVVVGDRVELGAQARPVSRRRESTTEYGAPFPHPPLRRPLRPRV